ncbi:hypothetical protein OB905_00460 [Halobacteria archaeon AArc-dxtr1]|nr:hypothetical protein [Halobacteria archaeon AArc-dxtr1]
MTANVLISGNRIDYLTTHGTDLADGGIVTDNIITESVETDGGVEMCNNIIDDAFIKRGPT